jgi:hypothetical protein
MVLLLPLSRINIGGGNQERVSSVNLPQRSDRLGDQLHLVGAGSIQQIMDTYLRPGCAVMCSDTCKGRPKGKYLPVEHDDSGLAAACSDRR